MKKKLIFIALGLVLVQLVTSCGASRKKDCHGNKKTYNKAGGFWM